MAASHMALVQISALHFRSRAPAIRGHVVNESANEISHFVLPSLAITPNVNQINYLYIDRYVFMINKMENSNESKDLGDNEFWGILTQKQHNANKS